MYMYVHIIIYAINSNILHVAFEKISHTILSVQLELLTMNNWLNMTVIIVGLEIIIMVSTQASVDECAI